MASDDGRMANDAVPAAGGPAPAPPTVLAAPAAAPPSPSGRARARPGRPWGFWATLGWTALWIGLWFFMNVAAVTVVLVGLAVRDGNADLTAAAEDLGANGLLLSVICILQTPVLVALVVLVAWMRLPVREYLGLKALRWKEVFIWTAFLTVLLGMQDGLALLMGKPVVPPFMVQAYSTAGFLPLLVVALVVAAPLAEETLFRGLLFKGIAASRTGVVGAVLISSAVWAAIHFQYDLYGVGWIFVEGVFLGIVRWRTGSVTLTMLLHAIGNAIATIEAAVVVEGLL